jgi:MoaA/NifB/PqqE/SkfB family radical SAM enzyme
MIQLNDIKYIGIEATSFCNLHCPQCPRYDEQGFLNKWLTPGHLDVDKFKQNFDPASVPNLRTVMFEGSHGDCMMHPRILELLEFFNHVKDLQVVTNGTIRSPEWWQSLASVPNLTVTFSIDGLSDTNSIYRINSNFDTIINNAKSFIQAGGRAVWKYIVFKHNEHQIKQAEQFALDLGFKEFIIKPTIRSWWNGRVWPVKIDGQYQYDIETSDLVKDVRSHESVLAQKLYNKKDNTRPNCWLDRGRIFINHKGHVLPCCMTSEKTWQKDISSQLFQRLIGDLNLIDINQHAFEQIIKNDFYQNKLEKSFGSLDSMLPTCSGCVGGGLDNVS